MRDVRPMHKPATAIFHRGVAVVVAAGALAVPGVGAAAPAPVVQATGDSSQYAYLLTNDLSVKAGHCGVEKIEINHMSQGVTSTVKVFNPRGHVVFRRVSTHDTIGRLRLCAGKDYTGRYDAEMTIFWFDDEEDPLHTHFRFSVRR